MVQDRTEAIRAARAIREAAQAGDAAVDALGPLTREVPLEQLDQRLLGDAYAAALLNHMYYGLAMETLVDAGEIRWEEYREERNAQPRAVQQMLQARMNEERHWNREIADIPQQASEHASDLIFNYDMATEPSLQRVLEGVFADMQAADVRNEANLTAQLLDRQESAVLAVLSSELRDYVGGLAQDGITDQEHAQMYRALGAFERVSEALADKDHLTSVNYDRQPGELYYDVHGAAESALGEFRALTTPQREAERDVIDLSGGRGG